jgi:prepilin-type N-terminal cleavage/methylation domain-containing protein
MWRLRKRLPGCRAMTLIEVLVVSVILVVVGGLLLGLLIPMRMNCMAGQDRLAMLSQARLVADGVLSVLESAVNPASLDAAPQATPLVFSEGKCVVISTKKSVGGDPQVYTIQNVNAGDTGCRQVSLATAPLSPDQNAAKSSPGKPETLGAMGNRYSTTVSFSYATQMDSVETVQFQKELPAGTYPRLVRVHVSVKGIDKKLPDVQITASAPML